MIVIVDYNMGNLGSIQNMLKRIGTEAKISSDFLDIKNANRLILPGVGAFDTGMKHLFEMDIVSILNKKVLEDKIPILGICLGMQLMTKKSEEGAMAGLGWIDADIIRFKFNKQQKTLKVPHMGWNYIKVVKENAIFKEVDENTRFYFVHSYHVICNKNEDILATTLYGYEFVSAINKDNIFGVQFHPEKSHKFGMKLLKKFLEL